MDFHGRALHWTFPALLAALLLAGPLPAAAQNRGSAAPVIEQFYVESDDQLSAGSKISFTVEGTPGAKASVRIGGIARRIPLKEVEPGVYEGTYTVRSGDQISASSGARATLQRRNRSTSAQLSDTLGTTVGAIAAVPSQVLPSVLAIESFAVTPIDRIEPGAELSFTLNGTPGGQAAFTIEGVATDVPMREVRAGQYVGNYTVRRADKLTANTRVVGTLTTSGRTLRSNLSQSLVAEVRKPVIRNLSPADGETVVAGTAISVSGTFDDSSGGGIDPKKVTVSVGGKDVTGSTVITPQFFNYRADLGSGAYTAVVTATDRAGNTMRQTWKFTVAAPTSAAATAMLPLQILSHQNMGAIGTGLTEVRGRTAPEATVQVQVRAVSAVFGFFGVAQNLLTQSVQADANGDFAFRFTPLSSSKTKDMRYEITLTASKGGQSTVESLVLMPKT